MKIFELNRGNPEFSLGKSIHTTWLFTLYLKRKWYSPSRGKAFLISFSLISSCARLILRVTDLSQLAEAKIIELTQMHLDSRDRLCPQGRSNIPS